MNIVEKHYEKFILIALLVLFVILFGWQIITVISQQDENLESKLNINLGKPDYQLIDFTEPEYVQSEMFKKNSLRFAADSQHKAAKGYDLTVPPRLARCPSGAHLIPVEDFPKTDAELKAGKKCSYCGAPLENIPVETVSETGELISAGDSDRDGIPDQDEKRYNLNPNDSADAQDDNDYDGFSNYEEYRAKTDMNNPKSRPSYANKLFVVDVLQRPLEIRLKHFTEDEQGKTENWNIQFETKQLKNKKLRKRTVVTKIGGTFFAGEDDSEYKVKSVKEVWETSAKTGLKDNKSIVTLVRLSDNAEIAANLDEWLYDPNQTVEMIFNVDFVDDPYISGRVGETFVLGDDERGFDKYTLISVDSNKRTAKVRDANDKVEDVKLFTESERGKSKSGNGMYPTGMTGGMPAGMTGGMPAGMGPTAYPNGMVPGMMPNGGSSSKAGQRTRQNRTMPQY